MRPGFYLWVGKIPWRRAWQPTPVCFPGKPPWTQETGGLQAVGMQRVGHNWVSTQILDDDGLVSLDCYNNHRLGDLQTTFTSYCSGGWKVQVHGDSLFCLVKVLFLGSCLLVIHGSGKGVFLVLFYRGNNPIHEGFILTYSSHKGPTS